VLRLDPEQGAAGFLCSGSKQGVRQPGRARVFGHVNLKSFVRAVDTLTHDTLGPPAAKPARTAAQALNAAYDHGGALLSRLHMKAYSTY
jgi:hypothetical protein